MSTINMYYKYLFLFFALTLISNAKGHCSSEEDEEEDEASSPEEKLRKHLQKHVKDTNVPPFASNSSHQVNLKHGLSLINIVSFEDSHAGYGDITVMVWEKMIWQDVRMQWNPEDYGGITNIRIPSWRIWYPDIRLYNSLKRETDGYWVLGILYNTGEVLYIPPVKYTVRCEDLGSGSWKCPFTFGSWAYDQSMIDINYYEGQNRMDLSDLSHLSTLNVSSNVAVKENKKYPCCEEIYPSITYTLTLREK